MATSGQFGAVARQVSRLFTAGTVTGFSEGELLDRFVVRRDEAAFEALLTRHGPMVLGVCRRLLDDPSDVEDAFQATFLILVRKAGSLRARDLLANWLYGVALRVAKRARVNAARRRAREKPAAEGEEAAMPRNGANVDELGELRSILDDEVASLPEKFRLPVLLCYLQGLTHDEAAARLSCPVGTVRSRLAKARDLLRGRLTRRGAAPTSGFFAAGKLMGAAPEVPAALVHSTIQAAAQFAAGQALTAGTVSASAALLTEGALKAMALKKMITIAAVVTTLGAVTVVGGSQLRAQQRGDDAAQDRTASDPAAALRNYLDAANQRIEHDQARIAKLEEEVKRLKEMLAPQPAEQEGVKKGVDQQSAGKTSGRAGGEASGAGMAGMMGGAGGGAMRAGGSGQFSAGTSGGGMIGGMMGRGGAGMASGGAGEGMMAGGRMGGGSGMGMPGNMGMAPMMGGGGGRDMRKGGSRASNLPSLLQGPQETLVSMPRERDRVVVYDMKTHEGKVYRATRGTKIQPVVSMAGNGVIAVLVEPGATEIAAYDFNKKLWVTQVLKEPVKESDVGPALGTHSATYTTGHHVYAFSALAGRWDVLTLSDDAEPAGSLNGTPAYWQNGHLHLFDASTGRWEDIGMK